MVLYKTISFTQAGLYIAYSSIYAVVFPHHFPIQNVENIDVKRSSDVNFPVISDKAFCVRRKSSAIKSIVSVESLCWSVASI
jgi:hypothetical protein